MPSLSAQEQRHSPPLGGESSSYSTCRVLSATGALSRRSRLEDAYVIFTLAFMTSPFLGILTRRQELQGGSNDWELSLQIAIYFTAAIIILRHWGSFVRGLPDCKWALALVGLALLSPVWAVDPIFALRRAIVAAATTMFGIYFGTRYRRDEQLLLLCCALGMIAIMSAAMAVVVPQYGIDPFSDNRDWSGVFETKNMLGKVMALGGAGVACYSPEGSGRVVLRLLAFIGFGTLLVLSGAATAAVTTFVLLALALIYRGLRWRATAMITALMLLLATLTALIPIAFEHRAALFAFVGRDESLTGRTQLWDAVLVAIGKRPFLGYGFSSFWLGEVGPSVAVVDMVGWIPPHAHNGFLDICLDLGVVGALIFGVGFVQRFRTAILDYRVLKYRAAIWPLVFLSFLALYNITESTLLRANSLYWVLYMASMIRDVHPVGRALPVSVRREERQN